MRLPFVCLFPALFVTLAWAQAPKFTSVPVVENPELYCDFFQYHRGLVDVMRAAKTADPQAGPQLDQQMATQLHVDVQELAIVIAHTQQATEAYAKLAAERVADSTATKPAGAPAPTAAELASIYEFRRTRLTVTAVSAMIQNLSTASWNGLRAYITGTYRNTIYKP